MCDGWTNKKRRCICNFLVNSPKGTFFFYHRWILLICPSPCRCTMHTNKLK
jgi:hypothetical protein